MEGLQEVTKNGNTILMATHDYALLLKYPSKTLKCDNNEIYEVVQSKGGEYLIFFINMRVFTNAFFKHFSNHHS